MSRARALSFLAVTAFSGALLPGEEIRWESVLQLSPGTVEDREAWGRWRPALEAMARLSEDDVAALDRREGAVVEAVAQRNQAAIGLFALREGGRVSLPRPHGPEGAVEDGANLRRLAVLKAAAVKTQWRAGERAGAIRAATDLVRAGAEIADDACSVAGFLAGVSVLDSGVETTRWLAGQPEATPGGLSELRGALARAETACEEGVENALRGEFQLVFRVVLERMPVTRDPGLLLERFSTLGAVHAVADRTGIALVSAGPDKALLDREATLAIYGQALAAFIIGQRSDGTWRADRFATPWGERTKAWTAEIGPLVQVAIHDEMAAMNMEHRAALEATLATAENPFGKLLLLMMVADVDAIAGAGMRARDRVRAVAKQLGGAQGSALAPREFSS